MCVPRARSQCVAIRWEVRLSNDEQGYRHDCGRHFWQESSGLSQVRVGEEGLPTTYYLTVADEPILTHCELNNVEFVPMNDINAFFTSNPLAGIQPGGTLFVQTNKSTPEDVWANVPPKSKT